MKLLRSLYLAMLLLAITVGVKAQGVSSSTISGVVNDDKGQPLIGATVKAVHTPSGSVYGAITNDKGRYALPGLRVGGPYEITVSSEGYKESKQSNIFLVLGETSVIDVKVSEASSQLSDVVIDGAVDPIINGSRTGASTNISSVQLRTLPTVSRSLSDYTRLTPQANGQSFGGRSGSFNNFTVDGAVFNNAFGLSDRVGGQTGSEPISLDAIEQVSVNIAPFDVRQGSFTGAGINAVTRSGTNDFNGSVFFYTRNQNFTGNKVADLTLDRQPLTNTIAGFRVGGPIIKDKLFFFVVYEQERRSFPATTFVANRPGLPAPGAGSNTSAADAATLDGLSSFLNTNFNYNPGPYEGYSRTTVSDKFTARFDYNINENHKLSFKYNFLRSYADIPPSTSGAPPQGRNPSAAGLPFFNSWYRINNNLNQFVLELNSTFGAKFTNQFQAGYTAFRDFRNSVLGGEIPIFPLVDIRNGNANAPFLTAFGFEPFSANNILFTNVAQLSDNFTAYFGDHTITLGTYNEFYQFSNGFRPQYQGQYVFNSTTDFFSAANAYLANPTADPTAVGNRLTNTGTQFQLGWSNVPGEAFPFANLSAYQLGFYLQDVWNVKKNLNISAGVRLDVAGLTSNIIQNEQLAGGTNATSGINYGSGLAFRNSQDVGTTYSEKIDVTKLPNTAFLWSPRIGFNWDVFSNKELQVRGGTGVFTGRVPFVWVSNQISNTGMLFGSVNQIVGSGGVTSVPGFVPNAATIRNNTAFTGPLGGVPTGYNVAYTDPNFKYPQDWRTNIGADYKLPYGLTASVDVIYSKTLNAVYLENVNLPNAGFTAVGADNRDIFRNPVTLATTPRINVVNGVTLPANTDNLRISDAIKLRNTNNGHAFNATFQLRHQWKNLNSSIAYTYSESRTVNDGGSIAQSQWRDRSVSFDPNAAIATPSAFWQPHRIVAQATYRFEYAKYFATTIGLVYVGSPAGTYTYNYSGDMNGDGQNANDLIYIPASQSDIVLRDLHYNAATGQSRTGTPWPTQTVNGIPGVDPNVTIFAAQQWAALDAYISQDPYLSQHRGAYAERNAGLRPWLHRFDFSIKQDFYMEFSGKRHTFQVSLDILNVGNLINSAWGVEQFLNRSALLNFDSFTAGRTPQFTFPLLVNPVFTSLPVTAGDQGVKNTGTPLNTTFRNDLSTTSAWQMQLGLRYIFGE